MVYSSASDVDKCITLSLTFIFLLFDVAFFSFSEKKPIFYFI